jgi:hypothetical protein
VQQQASRNCLGREQFQATTIKAATSRKTRETADSDQELRRQQQARQIEVEVS